MPAHGRSTLLVYAAIAVIVVVLGLRRLDRDGAAATPAGASASAQPAGDARSVTGLAGASTRSGDPAITAQGGAGDATLERAPASVLVVHVAGAVRHPGVYRLRDGSRVADALARAGGVARGADSAAVNLAAKLVDGQQVLLPRRTAGGPATGGAGAAPASPAPAGGAAPATPGPISLASATLEQLDTLDGVGLITAQKILDWRQKTGGFASVDELAQIPGIGPKRLESLRSQVVP